jgi:hypothetical protein
VVVTAVAVAMADSVAAARAGLFFFAKSVRCGGRFFISGKRLYSLTAALACGCELHFRLQFKYGRSFANYARRFRHARKRKPGIIRKHSDPADFEAGCWSSGRRIDRQRRWPNWRCGRRSHRRARRTNLGQRSTGRANGEKGSEARPQTGHTAPRKKAFPPQGCKEEACTKSSEVTQRCHTWSDKGKTPSKIDIFAGEARPRPPASAIAASSSR